MIYIKKQKKNGIARKERLLAFADGGTSNFRRFN